MPLSTEAIATTYPLPVYNFRVDIDSSTISVAEVSGITIEREFVSYRHGLSYWEGQSVQTFRKDGFRPVTMRKGIVQGMQDLHAWMSEGGHAFRTVDVHLCDAAGDPVVSWHIAKALPVKIEAPTFDPDENTVAVETLEIMAAGISIEHQ